MKQVVGETGFEPATLCSQITRLSFGDNGVCQVSPYVPPYSTQWVSAPVTNRRGAFLTENKATAREGTATRKESCGNYTPYMYYVSRWFASPDPRPVACPCYGAGQWRQSRICATHGGPLPLKRSFNRWQWCAHSIQRLARRVTGQREGMVSLYDQIAILLSKPKKLLRAGCR